MDNLWSNTAHHHARERTTPMGRHRNQLDRMLTRTRSNRLRRLSDDHMGLHAQRLRAESFGEAPKVAVRFHLQLLNFLFG
jgi:hypothetical protein